MTRLFRGHEGEWSLESVRYHLLTHGINPSINIAWTRDGPIYTKLWYPGKEGKVVIQAAQLGWQESQAFAKLFSETHTDLPFHMQTRGMLTHEDLLVLLKPKREWLPETQRAEIALKQTSVCYSCNEKLGKDFEIDHKK